MVVFPSPKLHSNVEPGKDGELLVKFTSTGGQPPITSEPNKTCGLVLINTLSVKTSARHPGVEVLSVITCHPVVLNVTLLTEELAAVEGLAFKPKSQLNNAPGTIAVEGLKL